MCVTRVGHPVGLALVGVVRPAKREFHLYVRAMQDRADTLAPWLNARVRRT